MKNKNQRAGNWCANMEHCLWVQFFSANDTVTSIGKLVTSTISPVGHPTMTLHEISPSRSAAFSPNLYRWMFSEGHAYKGGGVAETVFRVLPDSKLEKHFGAGTLMIGYPYNQYEGDTDFSGSLLISVLCNGSKAKRFCYSGAAGSLEVVDGFWDRYLQVGRCAIDPEHQQHFWGNERYSIAGDTRTCLWCGQTHQRVLTPRIAIDESWSTT